MRLRTTSFTVGDAATGAAERLPRLLRTKTPGDILLQVFRRLVPVARSRPCRACTRGVTGSRRHPLRARLQRPADQGPRPVLRLRSTATDINSDRRCNHIYLLIVISQLSISNDDQFTHDGGESDELAFAVSQEPLIGPSQCLAVSSSRESRHEEDALDLWPTALCSAVSVGGFALPGDEAPSLPGRDLTSIEMSEFGHQGQESSCGFGSHAGHGGEDLGGSAQRIVLRDQGVDLAIDRRVSRHVRRGVR